MTATPEQLPLLTYAQPAVARNACLSGPEQSWRDLMEVHPAALLFPVMSDEELDTLGKDIAKNGLRQAVVLWTPEQPSPEPPKQVYLLDGVNRLEATERGFVDPKERDEAIRLALRVDKNGGRPDERGGAILLYGDTNPYEFVISANLLRRHLTRTQKRELTAKLIKLNPERSDREIARLCHVTDKTVKTVRQRLEATAEIPQFEKRTGADGKTRPARSSAREAASKAKTSTAQLRDIAIADFSKLLHKQPADTLDDLTRLLGGERARITQLPRQKRIELARNYLRALDLSVDDLTPGAGGG